MTLVTYVLYRIFGRLVKSFNLGVYMEVKSVKVGNVPLFAFKISPQAGQLASKILGSSFDHKSNVWYCPAYYPFGLQVVSEIKMMFPNTTFATSAVNRINQLKKSEKMIESGKKVKMEFKTEPMEHQHEALLKLILYYRIGVFWSCGVGKTKLAIDAIRYLKINTLFVCPSRLVENTVQEINTHSFSGELECYPIIGKQTKEKKWAMIDRAIDSKTDTPKVMIVGYETLSHTNQNEEIQYRDRIANFKYDLIIFDESHKLRSAMSTISNAASKLAAKAYRRILMTGTPSLGNPLHLYVQMRILMPWRYQNYFAYKNKFVINDRNNPRIIRGFKNLHIIRQQIDSFSIKKTKEECLDIPERQVIKVPIAMSDEQEEVYKSILEGVHESVEYNPLAILKMSKAHQVCGGTLVESPIDYTVCTKCPQISYCVDNKINAFSKKCINKDIERPTKTIIFEDNPKLKYLEELLTSIVHGESKKAIVWYRYTPEYNIIKDMMKRIKVKCIDYKKTGHKGVTKFQEEDVPYVFIAQIQSGSGITLTAAEYTIFYSLTFDLEHYEQARDRMYRKGQTKKTTEYHLTSVMYCGPGEKQITTVDQAVQDAMVRKVNINDAMLNQDFMKEFITKIMC